MSTIKHSAGTLLQFVVVGFCSRQGAQSGSISEQISIAAQRKQNKKYFAVYSSAISKSLWHQENKVVQFQSK